MQRYDRLHDEPPANYHLRRRPVAAVAESLALAVALLIAPLVLLHPAGPVMLAALAVSAVLVVQYR